MSEPILYINGYQIELAPGQIIAQTKQVNDIGGIETRQANYTNRFKALDTAHNRRAFGHLTAVGNSSNVPYQKNEAYLYSATGECFVYKGWANVGNVPGGGFDIYIYDGIIDLYKEIENKSLSDLGLEELEHTKSLDTVIDSWNPESPYRYIMADYGGKMYYDTDKVNIDYLVPSVNVKWLWDKLFDFYNLTYSGAVFLTEEFINLWMTFPKGIFSTLPEETIFETADIDIPVNGDPFQDVPNTKKSAFLVVDSTVINDLDNVVDDIHLFPGEAGLYRVELSGKISSWRLMYNPSADDYFAFTTKVDLWLAKNQSSVTDPDAIVPLMKLVEGIGSTSTAAKFEYSYNGVIQLEETDGLCFIFRSYYAGSGINNQSNLLYVIQDDDVPSTMRISKVEQSSISFTEELSDFSQKDFLTEIVTRFGLTIFKDKYSDHYEFLTLQERLQTAEIDDWSDRFVKVDGEVYAYGKYAQRNILAYNYNDKESTHNDGEIPVDNKNLEDSKTILKSKIYSPERVQTILLGRPTHTYKLWEKEANEDPIAPIQYKPLDKRFYFLRSMTINVPETTIGSETLAEDTTITSAPVETYFRMSFQEVVNDYYAPLQAILDKSIVQTISARLTDRDVANIDFRKLIYIEQTASYYLLNKLPNYISGKTAKAEIVRVKYSQQTEEPEQIPPDEEPETTIGFCVAWQSANLDNIKMSLAGEIDFTERLAGRNIHTSFSMGTITAYVIDGSTVPCSIPMTFTSKKASFNVNNLPVVTDKVLTSVTMVVDVVCTNSTFFELSETYSAEEELEQTTATFNECY